MRASLELSGTLVGRIWMPGVEAWKDVRERVSRSEHEPFALHVAPGEGARDLLLRAMMAHDGDFQSCSFLDATLKVSRTRMRGGGVVTTTRYLDLREAADVTDLFVPEEERDDWEICMADAGA